jgi:O-antigen/teichoic acid export membrane protein
MICIKIFGVYVMKIERTRNARRNVIFGVALKIYKIVLPFIMRSVMVYTLGIQYLGLNSLFTSVLQVLNLAELGVGSAMVFSMYRPIAEDDSDTICALINLYKWYYRLIGGVVLICGIAVTPFVPKLIKGDIPADVNIYILYWLNLGATVLSYWMFAYRNSILQAHQRTAVVSKVTIITDTLKYALQLVSLFLFKNFYSYLIAALFTQVLANIVTAVASKILYPLYEPRGRLPKESIKEINGRVKDLFTAKLGGTLLSSGDTIVISAFIGLNMLAVYQNYYYIMSSVISMITTIFDACTAGIGNSIVVESVEKNYRDFEKFAFMNIWVSGICICCFLNIYQPFMTLWMGGDNLLSRGCVVLLCMYFYLFITNQLMCLYKDAAGMWHEDRFRPLVGSVVNLSLNLALVKYIGIYAIILSTVISYIVVTIPWLTHNLFSVVFKRSCIQYIKKFIYYSVVVVVGAVTSYWLCGLLPDLGVLEIAFRFLLSVITANIVQYILLRGFEEYNESLEMVDRLTNYKFKRATNKLHFERRGR